MLMTAAIIGPAHGLRGEVIVDVRTDSPDTFDYGSTLVAEDGRNFTVEGVRTHKDRVLLRLTQVRTREEAEALRGVRLLVEAHEEEDAWYPHELKGLSARTPNGEELGTVSGLQVGAAQDLLLVATPSGRVMVPFVEELVPTVDVEEGIVVIDAPPGLFDDNAVDAREE